MSRAEQLPNCLLKAIAILLRLVCLFDLVERSSTMNSAFGSGSDGKASIEPGPPVLRKLSFDNCLCKSLMAASRSNTN
jgi:hypothetical protein